MHFLNQVCTENDCARLLQNPGPNLSAVPDVIHTQIYRYPEVDPSNICEMTLREVPMTRQYIPDSISISQHQTDLNVDVGVLVSYSTRLDVPVGSTTLRARGTPAAGPRFCRSRSAAQPRATCDRNLCPAESD